MRSITLLLLLLVLLIQGQAQQPQADALVAKGNEAYKLQQYDKAAEAYRQALQVDPANTSASFNLGNALFKDKKYEEAGQQFEALAQKTDDKNLQAKSLYNKGVAFTQQKKLEESIDAYKQSLRINPVDSFTRENLQRALNEKKQQQQQEQQQNQQQQQQKKKQDEHQQQPKPNKLNQQQAQQLLKALEEQEKKLQEKMMKKPSVPGQPDKDW